MKMSISLSVGVISFVQSEFSAQKRSMSQYSGKILCLSSCLLIIWHKGIPLGPVYMLPGTELPFARVTGRVGSSGRRRRTYSTPIVAPLSNNTSFCGALGTWTSRLLEALVACPLSCVVDAMGARVVGEVDVGDEVVGGDEGEDAICEAGGAVPTSFFHLAPRVLCHTGFSRSRRDLYAAQASSACGSLLPPGAVHDFLVWLLLPQVTHRCTADS